MISSVVLESIIRFSQSLIYAERYSSAAGSVGNWSSQGFSGTTLSMPWSSHSSIDACAMKFIPSQVCNKNVDGCRQYFPRSTVEAGLGHLQRARGLCAVVPHLSLSVPINMVVVNGTEYLMRYKVAADDPVLSRCMTASATAGRPK